MESARAVWLVVGYALVLAGLLAALNVVRIAGAALLGGTLSPASYVMAALVSGGLALVLCTGGYVTIRRIRHPAAAFGANLDWGRVLGP